MFPLQILARKELYQKQLFRTLISNYTTQAAVIKVTPRWHPEKGTPLMETI